MSKVGNTGYCGINDFDKKMCHCNGPNLKIDVMLWFFTCLGYFFLKKGVYLKYIVCISDLEDDFT